MHLPDGMALALFDSFETSYLSAITLGEYFANLSLGNFPEGQSIREQSSSILRGHTVWDAFEYRVFQILSCIARDRSFSGCIAKKIVDLAAYHADRNGAKSFFLNTRLCQSILSETLSEVDEPDYAQSIAVLRHDSHFIVKKLLSTWQDIMQRLNRLAAHSELQAAQLCAAYFQQFEEEEILWTLEARPFHPEFTA